MAFTTQNQGSSDPQEEEIRSIIDDLEQSISVNKSIISDFLYGESSKDCSQETDSTLLIPHKAYEYLQAENKRISEAIARIKSQTQEAEVKIMTANERSNESKKRRKNLISSKNQEMVQLRKQVQEKEQEIQKLELFLSQLDEEMKNFKEEEKADPVIIIEEGQKLIKKVTRQLKQAESQKEIEVKKCRDLEEELNQFRGKKGKFSSKTDEILNKTYGLDLNYESYMHCNQKSDDSSETLRSSDSSVEDMQLPDKNEYESKFHPALPKLNLSSMGQSFQQDIKLPSPRAEIRRLELAHAIKIEEEVSLNRIINFLQAQVDTLKKYKKDF